MQASQEIRDARIASAPRVHRASLELCLERTDLAWRLQSIPEEAACRGMFLNMLDERAGQLGAATQWEYRSYFLLYKFSSIKFYPLRDYVTRLVTLAQIHWGENAIYDGVRRIQAGAFDAWRTSLVGRTALAAVEPSFASMLRFLERAYSARVALNYSDLTVESVTPRSASIRFRNEYVYIEHAMVGALEAVAKLCGEQPRSTVELEDAFNGVVHIQLGGDLS